MTFALLSSHPLPVKTKSKVGNRIMASSNGSRILRSLAKELKQIYKKENYHEVPAYIYIQDQFRNFQVTGQKICRAQQEVEHVAKTYLCYLESARKQEELSKQYRGKGERSVESSAEIVGLKLPKLYTEDPPPKHPDH